MEVVLAIVVFMAVCAAFMLWDYYKPARFRTTYRNVNRRRGGGGGDSGATGHNSGFFHSSDGESGGDGGGGD